MIGENNFVAQVTNPVFTSFTVTNSNRVSINRTLNTEAKILNNIATQLASVDTILKQANQAVISSTFAW